MSENVIPSTISSFLFDSLRKRVIEGDLKPGQVLREQELCDFHGTSRGPIRESLRQLLQTGLVEHQPRRGFKVRDYRRKDIGQIYRLRATLEGMVISEFRGRDLMPLLEPLRQSCVRMQKARAASSFPEYFNENRQFHQAMIDFADNRSLAEVLEFVNEISLPLRYRLMGEAVPSGRSLSYHEEIVDLLSRGEIDIARAVTETHILENLDLAIAAYSLSDDENGVEEG